MDAAHLEPHSTTASKTDSSSEYWAGLPTDEIASEIAARVDRWYYYILTSGRLDTWDRSHRLHHQGLLDHGRVRFGGEGGEQVQLKNNVLRSITRHMVNLVVSQRPAFDCRAANSDYDSEAQCIFAQALLDVDVREKRLEDVGRKVTDYAVKYGTGWGTKIWDANSGPVIRVDPSTGRAIHSGDLKYSSKMPSEVICDYSADDSSRSQWYIVRDWVSRYEIASRFDPENEREKYDACMTAPNKMTSLAVHPEIGVRTNGLGVTFDFRIFEISDEIEVFTLWHSRTSAVPGGRRTTVVNDTVIDDGPLPYDRPPIFRMDAGQQDGVSFGYTSVFDALSLQWMMNSMYSAAATNNSAFAIQSVMVPMGQGVSVKQLSAGMQQIEYDPTIVPGSATGGITPLTLTQTPPETYKFMQMLEQAIQTNLGINDVIRGVPQPSLKSGAALAMVASQALQSLVDLQSEYVHFLEDIATGAVEDYKRFATEPRVAMIAGKNNRALQKSWTKKDLAGVNRVLVDIGNPLSRTIAGRMELAQQITALDPKDRAAFIEVMATGRLEPVIEGDLQEDLTVNSENEQLAEARSPITLATDNHAQHIMGHKRVLGSPEARENPAVQTATLSHIQEHIEIYKDLSMNNPELLALTGQPVLPPSEPPLGGAGTPLEGENPMEGVPSGNISPVPAALGGEMPRMPKMPIDPQTGQRVEAEYPGQSNPTPGVMPA